MNGSIRPFAALLIAAALACSVSTAAAPIEIRFVSIAPEGTPWSEQMTAMKNRVEKESGGRLVFKLYLGGQLGGEVETLRSLERGRIQAWGGSAGALAGLIPEMQMLELPYLFHTLDEADYLLDEVLFRPYSDLLSKKGLTLQSWNENGWRSIGSKQKPILTPADAKGLKARSQPSPIHLRMWKALGANPVAISVPEVLTSLQTGVVDAFDNSPLFTTATSWHTAIKHYSLTQHIYQPGAVIFNKAFLDKLPEDLRKILMGDAKAEAATGRAGVRALEPEVLKLMETEGVTVHRLTDAQRNAFAAVLEPLHEEFAKTVGSDLLARTRKALGEYRDRHKAGPTAAPMTAPAPKQPTR
ncbi:MAG: C4-dicarboxylate transporter substrate-binding protein [Fibrobacteres bacterium]|nr:C4-dicarboxylate transporter substrate-binding protein [Fibrobacterota bacterium]